MRIVLSTLIALALTACSGGTDSSDSSAPDTTGDALTQDALPDSAGVDLSETSAEPDSQSDTAVDLPPPPPPGTIRLIHFSDVHYTGNPANPGPDNILDGVNELNSLDFAADLAVITGDLIDAMPAGFDEPGVEGPLHLFKQHISVLDVPWQATPGNHDYYISMYPTMSQVTDKPAREATIKSALGHDPLYYSVDLNGIRLVMLNSMDGELWDQNSGLVGSFSDAQIDWLDEQLSAGMPSLLFLHHPPGTTSSVEGQPTLCDLIQAHPGTVKGVFSGHLHGFQKGEYCGVPSYIVAWFHPPDPFYYLIEYDGPSDTLTIVNEDEIPFATIPTFECTPGKEVLDPTPLVGKVHQLVPANMTTDASEVAQYAGDVFEAIPFMVSFDQVDGSKLSARMTLGADFGGVEGFIDYVAGAPCLDFPFEYNDPCFVAGPVNFSVDGSLFLGLLLGDPNAFPWELEIPIENFWLEGRMGNAGASPAIVEGILHARLIGSSMVNDMKAIFANEYCAGHMEGCVPGASDDMPECPNPQPGMKFYPNVPATCDLSVAGYSFRMVLTMAEAFGFGDMEAIGELTSKPVSLSAEPHAGSASDKLFDSSDGMNCGK